ncbi:MAG: hypothetical protein EI684_11550 [Candidatus Viridilinea halotolerans]|uniref:Uncharacterized protein n=1 Tax=Candidatus Viridilinea halotolerans TaxID=2491704 RepID=A0A426TZ78_9CHLR|nr:MAG: hypothetical protein EI684_11550 [Candidatus Viridilinea halotolerans]
MGRNLRKEEGGRRKEGGGRRKEEGGRKKEEGRRRKEGAGRLSDIQFFALPLSDTVQRDKKASRGV